MQFTSHDPDFEALNQSLNDTDALRSYAAAHNHFRPSFLPALAGNFLVLCGNIWYGTKPSYLKFRAVEVIARVPYHSWQSGIYTLLTLFYTNEQKALELAHASRFARHAQDNETMHVVVISQLAKREMRAGVIRYTLIPVLFAFAYFWFSYLLYLLNRRWSHELNYVFENHAFQQYSEFVETNAEMLKGKPIQSEFLTWYGRHPENQYEFFRSVRNDEVVHRNKTLEEVGLG
jgi:ubiquinol oxidase